MLPCSTHLTPVIGLDIHFSTSGNPFHPYIGMVIDPFDYIPFLGSSVNVNGLKRGVSDTGGMLITFKHIPLFGGFVLMPMIGHESMNFFSSQTVFAEGTRLSPKSYMLMTCNDAGIPLSGAVSKPGKKKIPFTPTMFAPTSFSIPIPTGPPVMVGGPYAPDWGGALNGLASSIGFSSMLSFAPALFKAMKRAGKNGGKLSKEYANKARKLMSGISDNTSLPRRKKSPSIPKGDPIKPKPPFKENPTHKAVSPDEFSKQLRKQEDAINNMSVQDWLRNREDFKKRNAGLLDSNNMSKKDFDKHSRQAKKEYRKIARQDEYDRLRKHGISKTEASKRADEYMKGKSALHNPDAIAGGNAADVTSMGNSRVNSSIGSQWRNGRAESIESQIKSRYGIPPKGIDDIPQSDMMNVKLI